MSDRMRVLEDRQPACLTVLSLDGKSWSRDTSYLMDQDDTQAYFLQIHDTYANDIYRFCLMKVSSREIAQDLTQEVFMRFWQALREGTKMRSERALLYTMARNLIIDWYRKKKEASLDAISEQGIEFMGEDRKDIERSAEVREALGIISGLDESSREALTLRYVDGFSPSDIARMTGESANAVSVRINRAMKKVRARMHTDE